MNALMERILDTPAPYGCAVLWWLGQMGLMVRMGDTLVCIDYFATPSDDRQVPPPVPTEEVTGVHAFLGSHNHRDHIDTDAWKVWAGTNADACFVFPGYHMAELQAQGIPGKRCVGLNDGACCRIGEITIRAIAAAHEFLDRDKDTGLYPCLQYILEGNGVRIYHAGDTLRYEGMAPKLRKLGPFDAVLLPINGRDGKRYRRNCIGNMTFQEAADLAGELPLGMVIPGHWDMFRDNSADPAEFEDYLDAKYPGRMICRIPRITEPILVKAEN